MELNEQRTAYFLGSNSSSGFYSVFSDMEELKKLSHYYILKGGPGTGKSTFMKSLANAFIETGHPVELYFCSSDPDSLDGFLVPDLMVAFVDGTAPHTIDPKYPGVVEEIINLGEFWDSSRLLPNRDEIIALTDQISAAFASAFLYLGSAKQLRDDTTAITLSALNEERLMRLCDRLARKEFHKSTGHEGRILRRFLTGITPKGVVSLAPWLEDNEYRVYNLKDDYHTASPLLSRLADEACAKGYSVYLCPCPFAPEYDMEHLVIPELKLAFVSSTRYHTYEGPCERTINLNRYLDPEILRLRRIRLRFNRKMLDLLTQKAVDSLEHAKHLHDKLESYYVAGMDFTGLDLLEKTLLYDLLP